MSPMLHKRKIGSRFYGLFTGSNGSGKTVATGSMPGPILVFDFDGRIDPLKLFYPNREDIEYYTVGLESKSRSDIISFKEFLKKFDELETNCPYGTVTIDSYTMFSTVAVLSQMGFRKEEDLKRTKGGLAIPDWDEFKGETGSAVQVLETSKIIPAHFIMTAHPVSKAQTTKQTGSTNEILQSMVRASTLATYGWKTVSILPAYFNEMYYFYTDVFSQIGQQNNYKVQTVSAGEIVAKTALPLPQQFDITNKPFWNVVNSHIADYENKRAEKLAAREAARLAEEAEGR